MEPTAEETIGPIGRLMRVPLRDVWPHEALNFTRWLESNLEILNDHLQIELTSGQREQSAGAFSVDLVAEDAEGNTVIVENQLERSDHDHLGKVITYLASYDAKTAIWIVADPRPEHVRAVSWLNDSTSANFYLFKAEAIRIEGSPPAPLLTQIVGPADDKASVAATKKDRSDRLRLRLAYWTTVLGVAKDQGKLFSGISPGSGPYVSAGSGIGGVVFQYGVRQHDAYLILSIDRGKGADDQNLAIFDQLAAHQEAIETSFGGELEWDRLDGRRSCKIVAQTDAGGWKDEREDWPDYAETLVSAMERFHGALSPYLDQLDTTALSAVAEEIDRAQHKTS